jgi:hypothetical protein
MRWNLRDLPGSVREQVLLAHPELAVPSSAKGKRSAESPGQARLTEALRAAWGPRVCAEYRPFPDRRIRVDIALPDARLAIEVNGWTNHGKSLDAFTKDHQRTRLLMLAGWRVLPFTHREALYETADCVEVVRRLLA